MEQPNMAIGAKEGVWLLVCVCDALAAPGQAQAQAGSAGLLNCF